MLIINKKKLLHLKKLKTFVFFNFLNSLFQILKLLYKYLTSYLIYNKVILFFCFVKFLPFNQ